MKKEFAKPFGAVVELKQLGFSVVSARVVFPAFVCYYDARILSAFIMESLVSDASIVVHHLDDGSFILCKASAAASLELTLVSCVRQESKFLQFPVSISLDDGEEYNTMVSLDHRYDCRRDYFVNQCRVIDLRGTISVEVDGDEEETLEA